jgi:hypothetical protein
VVLAVDPGRGAKTERRQGLCLHGPENEVIPHAIIWRSLRYCTLVVREGEDDLDKYSGASFVIGNDIRFDLRVYRGHIHSEVTVTLYLPEEVQDERQVAQTISTIIREMAIPVSAVAWRRGLEFQFGKLGRAPDDRLRESEARILILKIAASQPGRSASSDKLRQEIPKMSPSRKQEMLWQIVVRNTMSSHTTGTRTIFAQGWAIKIPNGLTVTTSGLDYLNSIGFLDSSECDLTEAE